MTIQDVSIVGSSTFQYGLANRNVVNYRLMTSQVFKKLSSYLKLDQLHLITIIIKNDVG